MQTCARPADVVFFRCGPCGTELSVPVALQGIEGPCPCCGERIKAPWYDMFGGPATVHLPPLNRRHEPAPVHTESIPVPDWMEQAGREARQGCETPVAVGLVEPRPAATRLLPRRLSGYEIRGFQARIAIPVSDEPLDEAWRLRQAEAQRRRSWFKKMDAAASRLLEFSGFRLVRMALLVTTGGLCAGVGLYLKDRRWVLDLPWKPAPVESVVEVPVLARPLRPAEPANPFLTEDPSEMEVLSPLPEASAVPVGATPAAAVK